MTREEFKTVVSRCKKSARGLRIVPADIARHGLEIAENELAFLPARIHSRLERIFWRLERSPGKNRPLAASASFSRRPGGQSPSARSQSGQSNASNSARSDAESFSTASLIWATVLMTES